MSRPFLLAVLLACAPFALPVQAAAPAAAPAAGAAASPAAGAAASPIAAFTDGLEGLRGRFVQRVFDARGNQREESSGSIALAAPRQFRWEYEQPFPQLIVADGDHVWIYDPDLEQVTVRNQSAEEQNSPLSVLIDPTELDRQYKVSDGGKSGGLEWLLLAPKKGEDASFKQARLGFGAAGLVRMELDDSLGQRTVIGFGPWQRNPKFSAATFRFTPPPGTDVVGTPVRKAQVTPLQD